MRVKCIAVSPSEDQIRRLGRFFERGKSDYDLLLHQEYLVLGLGHWDHISWIEIPTSGGWILTVPLFLFAISDPRASRYWVGEADADGASLRLRPTLLYDPSLNSRLADDEPEVVERYQTLLADMYAEAGLSPVWGTSPGTVGRPR